MTEVKCIACLRVGPPREFLSVTDTHTGTVRFVCRPGVRSEPPGRCFASVGSRDRYAIAPADPTAA